MISLHVIVLGLVLHLVPPTADTFAVTGPENETTRYARQPLGAWQAVPPPKTGERYRLDGAALVIETQGGKLPIDFAMLCGVAADADWQAIDRLTVGNTVITLERREGGVDVLIDAQQQAGGVRRTVYGARWTPSGG